MSELWAKTNETIFRTKSLVVDKETKELNYNCN